jgi:hypothetical protein
MNQHPVYLSGALSVLRPADPCDLAGEGLSSLTMVFAHH